MGPGWVTEGHCRRTGARAHASSCARTLIPVCMKWGWGGVGREGHTFLSCAFVVVSWQRGHVVGAVELLGFVCPLVLSHVLFKSFF